MLTLSRSTLPVRANIRPGTIERCTAGLTFFVFAYGLPNEWFRSASAEDESTMLARLTLVLLVSIAIMRVLGSSTLWIKIIQLDGRHSWLSLMIPLSVLWSTDTLNTLRLGGELLLASLFAAYVMMRFSMREWLLLAAGGAAISSLISLFLVLALPQYGIEVGLWTGLFGNKNLLALQSAFDIVIVVVAARSNPRYRLPLYAAACIHFVLLLGSQGITSLLGFLLTIAALPVYHGLRGRSTLPGMVASTFAAIGVVSTAFVTANLGAVTEFVGKDVTFTGRTELWSGLAPLVADRPILGYGRGGAFGGYFSPVHDIWVSGNWEPTHAHNSLYQVLIDFGIVGLLLFVAMFIRAIKRSIQFLQAIPGTLGLLPITVLTLSFSVSITETGVLASNSRWLIFSLVVLTVGFKSAEDVRPGSTRDVRDDSGASTVQRRGRSRRSMS